MSGRSYRCKSVEKVGEWNRGSSDKFRTETDKTADTLTSIHVALRRLVLFSDFLFNS